MMGFNSSSSPFVCVAFPSARTPHNKVHTTRCQLTKSKVTFRNGGPRREVVATLRGRNAGKRRTKKTTVYECTVHTRTVPVKKKKTDEKIHAHGDWCNSDDVYKRREKGKQAVQKAQLEPNEQWGRGNELIAQRRGNRSLPPLRGAAGRPKQQGCPPPEAAKTTTGGGAHGRG